MSYLGWLERQVAQAIAAGRIGTPVSLRAHFHLSADHGRLVSTLAEALGTAASWFGSATTRIYVLGSVRAGEITALAEYAAGQTALISAAALRDPVSLADLLLVGNHGTLRHQDHPPAGEPGAVNPKLLRAIEASLASQAPAEVER